MMEAVRLEVGWGSVDRMSVIDNEDGNGGG